MVNLMAKNKEKIDEICCAPKHFNHINQPVDSQKGINV